MKSFSSKVKKEISCTEIKNPENAYSLAYGILLFGGKIKENTLNLCSENNEVSNLISSLIEILYPNLKYEKLNKESKKNIFSFKIDSNEKIFSNIKNASKENLPKNIKLFISGAFLSCGSITDPNLDYHLEFNFQNMKLCEILTYAFKKLKGVNFNPKTIKRRSGYCVYMKENEKIEDFLVLVGAKSCAMEFMQVKMIKEVRNNINRSTNFETANLSKITDSSCKQIKAIKKIISHKKMDSLPNALKETAKIRLKHPYAPLKELASFYKKPVSKSGVNHRLKKILEIAEKL